MFLYVIYMFFGYLIYPFLLIIFSVMMIFDKTIRKGALSRLGFIYPKRSDGQSVWIHAVSVGEVSAVYQIVGKMLEKNYKIYLSTTTATGYDRALQIYADKVELFYLSLDYNFMMEKVVSLISPEYVLIAEIEIWPCFIYTLHKKGIPIYLINGRIGKKELRAYKPFKFFFTRYYNMYKKVFAQSETDKKNMIAIGMNEERVLVTGNLKYDLHYNMIEEKYDAIKTMPPKNRLVLVIGSSHAGEEEGILKAVTEANLQDKLYIVIVPRDIKRGEEVFASAKSIGYNLPLYTNRASRTEEGIIINVIGELLYWYKRSDIVIMGGSFSANVGGHNILEAVYFSKPVIVGSHMHNFIDMYEYMKDTIITCKSYKELIPVLTELSNDEQMRTLTGSCALVLLTDNRGATENIINAIDRQQGVIKN